ncbi:MAG: glycosyltransferase, partial [Planctomycetaceae bacterium]
PTQGENFGHAIFESLAVGTPVLISDQTMWRELAAQSAGWDLSLDDLSSFSEALQEFARMDPATRHTWRRNAHRIATEFFAKSNLRQGYLDLFFGTTPFRATDSKPH